MPRACSSDRKATRSCRLRPSRPTDQAMTTSNFCRVTKANSKRLGNYRRIAEAKQRASCGFASRKPSLARVILRRQHDRNDLGAKGPRCGGD